MKTAKYALYLFPIIPILLSLFVLLTKGGVLPFWDEWNALAPVAIKTAQGTLTLEDILRQHNEHKMVFTKLVTAGVTLFTHWNIRVELVISVLLGCGITGLIVINLRKITTMQTALAATIASGLVFALRDYGNLILPSETLVFFVMLFFFGAVTALYCLTNRWLALSIAALCGFGAVFAFLSGWVIWPLILVALPFLGYRNWRFIAFWIVAGAITLAIFLLTDYNFVNSTTSTVQVPVFSYVYYFLAYLGSIFVPGSVWSVPISAVIGLLGIGLIVVNGWLVHREKGREVAFWLVLAGYSVGTAILSAIGRTAAFLSTTPNQPLETRYVIHTVPFWLAAIFLTLQALPQLHIYPATRRVYQVLRPVYRLALGGLLIAYLVINSLLILAIRPVVTPEHVACALAYHDTRDVSCMKGIYPDGQLEELRPYLDALYENRLSVFQGR